MSEHDEDQLYVVWAEREPGPKFCKVSVPLPKLDAIRVLRVQWKHGVKARLDPPLGKVVDTSDELEVLNTA